MLTNEYQQDHVKKVSKNLCVLVLWTQVTSASEGLRGIMPRREVPEPAVRRLQTRRMPLWNAWDCFITENLVLPVMYDSVHSVLVKQHGYIQWTNCTKNTLLGN